MVRCKGGLMEVEWWSAVRNECAPYGMACAGGHMVEPLGRRPLRCDGFEDRQARLRWSLARSDCPQAQAAGQGA